MAKRSRRVAANTYPLWATLDAPVRAVPTPVVPEARSLAEIREPAEVLARLAAVDWSFTADDTSYLGHDLHPYPAKFIPQIPANLISALSLRGELIWDPFGGSGTTPLEALLLGRRALSTDVNPLATLITEAKCAALSPEQHDDLRKLHMQARSLAEAHDVERAVNSAWPRSARQVPQIPNIDEWFSTSVTRELAYVKDQISQLDDPAAQRFANVALSSIVVKVSNQDGETRYARRPQHLPPGRTLRAFAQALSDALVKHEPMEDLLGYRRPRVVTTDARHLDEVEPDTVPASSVDLVVTSPPYANATDYHLYHRFRLFWLGFDPRDMAQHEVGSHLRHQREKQGFDLYLADMRPVLKSISTRLRVGRYAVFVVGDSVFDGKTISTAEALSTLAESVGLEVVGVVSRTVHATRRSFIAAARRTRSEDLLILRRTPHRLTVHFRAAPYRMWPYEDALRRREIAAVLHIEPRKPGDVQTAELSPYELDRAQRLAFTHLLEVEGGTPSWRTWQAILENGNAEAGRKDPKYATHGIHPYKGKFYPQLCKALLNLADLEPGATVLDPFCGSGTVLLEAQLNGHVATGCDMNPLAVLIAKAKTGVATTSAVALDRALKDFRDRTSTDKSDARSADYFVPPLRAEVDNWFPAPVTRRLGWLLALIERVPNMTAGDVLRVLLSSIIRQVSQQEPADLRIRRRKEPLEDAPVLDLLHARIDDFRTRLQNFGERTSSSPFSFAPATVVDGDARLWSTLAGMERRVDCIVTSPPYATALPYIDTDRLSILTILGLGAPERALLDQGLTGSREIRETQRRQLEAALSAPGLAKELRSPTAARLVRQVHRLNRAADVGFRRRNMAALLFRYFDDMRRVFENLTRVIRPGGRLSFVIGDNKTIAGESPIDITSGKVLAELGESMGWKLVDSIPISVTKDAHLHSHNSITENVVLCFQA